MGYIGNMYPYFPQARFDRTDGKCIVKVFCIFRVNGKSRYLTEIFTLGIILRCNDIRNLISSSLYMGWINIRQSILSQDGMHFSGIVSRLSKNVHHLSDRVLGIFRPLNYLDHRLITIFPTFQLFLRNEDIIGKHLAFGKQESIELFYFQCTDKSIVGAFDHLNHFSFKHSSFPLGTKHHFHLIAMHGMSRFPFGNKNCFTTIFGNERILSVTLSLESTGHHQSMIIEFIMSMLNYLQECIFHHLINNIHTKHLERMRSKIQTTE